MSIIQLAEKLYTVDDYYKMGEEVKAYVVLNDEKTVSEADLMAYTKEHIASYKYPRIIEFIDVLPMSATGKILKKELRKL